MSPPMRPLDPGPFGRCALHLASSKPSETLDDGRGKRERERLKEARRSEAQSLHRISDGMLPGFARVVSPTDRSGEFER